MPGTGETWAEAYIQVKDDAFTYSTGKYQFCLVYKEEITGKFTSPILSDLNKDGAVDIVYNDIDPLTDSSYKIFFNRYPAKQPSYKGGLCYDPVTPEIIQKD
jgi:hypothetical protein